ncbi:hypothetical protein MBCUT_20740 [Methanobrevibacter cuticularis]|uniref:Right handed beta helix domain-containing protein n=1 Tax=Methanobrevibacter cuticularis TaxID=47311 RepID=A0A166CH64_9EURY|nr:carboxypeptidase-like regulatory domain-containing protein [Methanobrevibacter cuticularis]KZX14502.1 hypothetical protein MBCUT_20740 [Methanobrevibacter cuticularis]
MFKNKRFMSFSLIVLAILVCFTLSSVSAGSYDFTNSSNTQDFQNLIDNDIDDELEINLTSGSYTNLGQINITRNATIQGKNNPVITGPGSGILFNITTPNVRIINLTIIGYDTAISSNSSDLTIMGNNITTSGISINLTSSGEDLTGISIKDNIIVSSIANSDHGAVFVHAPDYSGAVIDVSFINNNITSNGTSNSNGVRFYTIGCSFDLIFENNNITGTYSSVYLITDSSNNSQFTFNNNNITGATYGVYLRARSSNNTNITFTNNNITGTDAYGYGVYLGASDTNNTNITFTNITATSTYVVYLVADRSNNLQFTFTNNNITGTGSSTYSVYLSASSSNNSQFTFTNNNITGTSIYGVSLSASSSNNLQFAFTNNSIAVTGSYGTGVSLSAPSSNNSQFTFTNNNIAVTGSFVYGVSLFVNLVNNVNITFTNNNVTGTYEGVYLYALSSNNSQFTFTNNNITGKDDGVSLYASSSNNTNITFNGNSITGVDYGVYVPLNGNVSGVSFLNNTVNATSGNGFYFYTIGSAPTNISDSVIRGNTIYAVNGAGLNFTRLFAGSRVNVTVEYNRIISLVGVNITGYNDNSSFDHNWWGVNDISNKIFGIDTNNHYILNITNSSSLDDVHFGDIVRFYLLVLNTTLNNSGVENLPDFVINGTLNNVDYVVSRDDGFIYKFAVPKVGNNTLNASLDAAYNITSFIATKASTNSTIVVNPNPAQIGENVTVSGVLANHTGIGFVNVTVDGTLFANVTVDVSGYWELNYTTNRTGTDLEVIVSFAGNENYTSFTNTTNFNVTKLGANSTVNIPRTVKTGKTITIDGVLVDENGNPIANAPINVTVDGKVYSLTTDSNGRWSLTYKPTHTGNVNIMVDYAGNDKYFIYTNTTTFNVIKGEAIVDMDVVKNSDGSVDVIVTVTDEDGDPICDYKVTVDLDGKNIGNIVTNFLGVGGIHIPSNELSDGKHVITVLSDNLNYYSDPVSVEFETQNKDNDNNDTNNTNKTNNNPVASATMKNTGMPIIAIILVLISMFGIILRRKT